MKNCPEDGTPFLTHGKDAITLGLDDLSLIDRARALCAAADDVQRATIEATRRIAAIHGTPTKRKKKKDASRKPEKEPPDICARPPSDIPPPRGERWRRLGPVSVVRGSNRICAPARFRRALTREVEVFLGGERYLVVPADIDPGGGFCVTLNRDIEGESNMACMLYLRRKEQSVVVAAKTNLRKEPYTVSLPSKVKSPCSTHSTLSTTATAQFDSNEPRLITKGENKLRSISVETERELGGFAVSMLDERIDRLKFTAVREAQQKAQRRARYERKREIEAVTTKENIEFAKKKPCAANAERLKETRRTALARVVSVKMQEARRREAQQKIGEERRRRGAEAAAKATGLQATALARAAKVAAENRQRKRELALVIQEEARVKRERVTAVLAYEPTNASERERKIRDETSWRIQREERRRELALQHEEDERLEKIRLYEGRQRRIARPIPPVVPSTRSFFSVAGSVVASETIDEGDDPTVTILVSRAPDGVEETSQQSDLSGICDNGDDTFISGSGMLNSEHFQWQAKQPRNCDLNRQRTTVAARYRPEEYSPSPPSFSERSSSSTLNGDSASRLEQCSDAKIDPEAGERSESAGGTVRNHGLLSPTPPSSGTGSASASGTTSAGSSGSNKSNRKRITATPVWKRPVVPLSKPYVPVPRKGGVFARG